MVRIVWVGCRQTVSNRAEVRMIDISPGGARFVSALMFPVDSDVILQLALVLEGTQFCMEGFVVSRTVIEGNEYEYGFCFSRPENRLKSVLVPVLGRTVNRNKRHIIVIMPCDGYYNN